MRRATGSRKNLLLTLWLLLPFAVLAGIVAVIFLSYGNKKMDARPVGQGARDTGGANALGELLAGNNPIEKERIARDLREGKLIDPLDWPGGIDLIVEGDGLELGLLVAWGSTDALRTTTIMAGEPSFIEHAEIRAVFGSTSPNAGYYLADKDITNRNGRPTSKHGRIVKLVFPPVAAAEAVEGEPLSIRVSLAPEQDD
jgi:hypothetical protein